MNNEEQVTKFEQWQKWLQANYDASKAIELNTSRNLAMEKQRAMAGFIAALKIIKGQNK